MKMKSSRVATLPFSFPLRIEVWKHFFFLEFQFLLCLLSCHFFFFSSLFPSSSYLLTLLSFQKMSAVLLQYLERLFFLKCVLTFGCQLQEWEKNQLELKICWKTDVICVPFTNKNNNKKIPTCLSCEKFMTRLSCHGMVNKTALLRDWF